MKKNLKRALSIVMAVMMVMTSWVFLAPQKAAAANGDYYVKITWKVTAYNENWKGDRIYYGSNYSGWSNRGNKQAGFSLFYQNNNGTGNTEKEVYWNIGKGKSGSSGVSNTGDVKYIGTYCATATVSGFPTKLYGYNNNDNTWHACKWDITKVEIGPSSSDLHTLYEATAHTDSTNSEYYFKIDMGVGSGNNDSYGYANSDTTHWKAPYPIVYLSSTTTDITVPKWGGTNQTATINYVLKDQYNVNWYEQNNNTFGVSKTTTGTYTNSNYTGASLNSYTTGSSKTLTVTADAQKVNDSTTNNQRKLYVTSKYNNTSTGKSATGYYAINMNNQKYTWEFYPQNPVNRFLASNDRAVKVTKANNTTQNFNSTSNAATAKYTEELYYYFPSKTYPTKMEIDSGYVYEGLKTTTQTEAEVYRKGSYTATGTAFSSSSINTAKAYSNGTYTPPLTYYAHWWAKDFTVTFQNNHGDTLKTITAKYDKAVSYLSDEYNKIPSNPERIAPPNSTGSYNYVFKDYVVSYAEDADGKNITSSALGESYSTYIIKGKTTFEAVYDISSTRSYSVKFIHNNGTSNQSLGYGLQPTVPTDSACAKPASHEYTYTFKGWTVSKDAEPTIKVVDKGVYVPLVNVDNLTVRDNVTYVAVYEQELIPYTVKFTWKQDTADGFKPVTIENTYHWGDSVYVPDVANEYPEYSTGGNTYRFTGWDFGNPITVIAENNSGTAIPFTVLDEDNTEIEYIALYDGGTAAVYTVTVLDRDRENFTADPAEYVEVSSAQYEHGASIETPADPAPYRDTVGKVEYRFDHWVDQFDSYGFSNIANGHRTYKPVYVTVPLYEIEYYNEGAYLGSRYYTEDEAIADPAFAEPVEKEEDMLASEYTFLDWMTGSGWKVKADSVAYATMPAKDLQLHAKYTPTYKNYTVSFYNDVLDENDENVLISEQTYHFGDTVNIPADPTKPADNTFTYTFKGWDDDIPAYCLGNAQYTATYRKAYNYYNVLWLDKDGAALKSEYYIWNERINTPAMTITAPDYPDDPSTAEDESTLYSWKHSGWQRVTSFTTDETGKIVSWNSSVVGADFVRGERMTGTIVYKPTFEKATKTYTVSVYDEDGTTLIYELEATHNEDISEVLEAPRKPYTDDTHYAFAGWCNLDGTPANLVITSDISIKSSFSEGTHDYDEEHYEVVSASTYFLEGTATVYCECGKEGTISLPKKQDNTAPEAVLYVKDSVWSTDGASGTAANTVRVGRYSKVIVTSNDTGSGVLSIGKYLSKNYIADPSTIDEDNWDYTTFGTYEDGQPVIGADGGIQLLGENPNCNGYIREYIEEYGVEANENFYLYYKIVDRMGRTSYINSDKLVYDSMEPVITFTGEERYNHKYCLDATFTVDAGDGDEAVVTVDGIVITPVDGVYTVDKTNVGLHQIISTDIAGNQTKENFEIVGAHSTKIYTTNPTCTVDGYTVSRCTLCQNEVGEKTTIERLGHNFGTPVIIEPTCTRDGSSTKYCFRCGYAEVTVPDELKATNEHTYGEWRVLEEATCSSEGSKIRVCSLCNAVENGTIAIDPDAHRYYRGVVTKPTCTEQGYTTHVCRYDTTEGKTHTKIDSYVDALGHDETGDWTVVTKPTCLGEGLKVKYCARTGCKDGNSNAPFIIESAVVEPLGHNWTFSHTVAPQVGVDGYNVYVCNRAGCTETENREPIPYLEQYDVTFVDEDGTELKKIEDVVEGSSITLGEAPIATKEADETYTYEFDKWVNADTDEEVTLPMIVTSDITLKATYKGKYIKYAITLLKEDGVTLVNKIGYRHYGEVYEIEEAPEKAMDSVYIYKFTGWTTGEDDFEPTTTITVTGDITLYATYKAVERTYDVIYTNVTHAGDETDLIVKLEGVVAGTAVTYDKETKTLTYTVYDDELNKVPETTVVDTTKVKEKAHDSLAHYVFSGWITDTSNIQDDIRVLPKYDAEEHNFIGVAVRNGCESKEKTTYTCDVCGESYEEITGYPIDHVWGEPDENGVMHCTNDNCDAENSNAKFTVKFYSNDGNTKIKTLIDVKYGDDITADVPTATKASDAYYDYTFEGWTDTKNGTTTVDVKTVVKSNATYYAVFSKTDRYYTVTFRYDGGKYIKAYRNVKAGTGVVYSGETPKYDNDGVHALAYDDYGHYVFANWNKDTSCILEDTEVKPVFNKIPHDLSNIIRTDATCTEPGGITKLCDCGYKELTGVGSPLGHRYEVIEEVAPELEVEGYRIEKCKNCGDTQRIILPAKEYFWITVTVLDTNHAPIEGARVSIFDKKEFITQGTTNSNGQVKLRVPEKKAYTIVIDRDDFGSVTGTITVNDDGTVDMSDVPPITVVTCNCTCHKSGFWPSIFRFFHKIVKLLTGDFGCCGNPDARYGKK